jgi:hypothetical protein
MHKLLEEQNKSKKMSEENTGIHKKERVKNSPHPLSKTFKIRAFCGKHDA